MGGALNCSRLTLAEEEWPDLPSGCRTRWASSSLGSGQQAPPQTFCASPPLLPPSLRLQPLSLGEARDVPGASRRQPFRVRTGWGRSETFCFHSTNSSRFVPAAVHHLVQLCQQLQHAPCHSSAGQKLVERDSVTQNCSCGDSVLFEERRLAEEKGAVHVLLLLGVVSEHVSVLPSQRSAAPAQERTRESFRDCTSPPATRAASTARTASSSKSGADSVAAVSTLINIRVHSWTMML